MPHLTVDRERAKNILEDAWRTAQTRKSNLDKETKNLINGILKRGIYAYTYAIITAILAKRTNRKINALALQASSTLEGAYSARTLFENVVSPFEYARGDMWGHSRTGYLSNPLRVPEFSKDKIAYRYKGEAAITQNVLEWTNTASNDDLDEALIYFMRLGMARLKNKPKIKVGSGGNLDRVRCFIDSFLSGPAAGGTRLAAVVAAFAAAFNPDIIVKVYSPNVSDRYSKNAGDIELWDGDKLVTAYEVKDRSFNEDDISAAIDKATTVGVKEYVFVSGHHSAPIEYDFSDDMAKTGLDLYSIHLPNVIQEWILALNFKKRALLAEKVIEFLTNMNRLAVAEDAQEAWASCSDELR